MGACSNLIEVGRTKAENQPITIPCGTMWTYGKEYCEDCLKKLKDMYPQGWRYYAGDTCKHGRYVGGCGVDWMCPACEFGDE